MPQLKNSGLVTHFQQIFAAFWRFLAEIWFLLFFNVSTPKFIKLLIINKGVVSKNTNQNQTNYDSNGAIATFENLPASKSSTAKTNLLKRPSSPLLFRFYALSGSFLLKC